MTKIYEALKLTEEGAPVTLTRKETVVALRPGSFREFKNVTEMQKKMTTLYWNITAALPEDEKHIIQFMDASKNGDGFIVVRQFVKTLASAFSKSVLLLDATFKAEHIHYFNLDQGRIWDNILRGRESISALAQSVDNTKLSVASFTIHGKPVTSLIDMKQLRLYLKQLQEQFDLIVIDTSLPEVSFDGVGLSGMTQGTVLIIEEEKTRWQVADDVRNRIEKNGGKIIGVFLNKRKNHIPRFLYKFL